MKPVHNSVHPGHWTFNCFCYQFPFGKLSAGLLYTSLSKPIKHQSVVVWHHRCSLTHHIFLQKNPKRPWQIWLLQDPLISSLLSFFPWYVFGRTEDVQAAHLLAPGSGHFQHTASLHSGFGIPGKLCSSSHEVQKPALGLMQPEGALWPFGHLKNVLVHVKISFSTIPQNLAVIGGNWAVSVILTRAFSKFRYGFPFPSHGFTAPGH